MAIKRTATAYWQGTGKEGTGQISTQSTVLNKTQYGYKSRFEDGPGTNPEELIGAAHAGCFTMKLAFTLQAAEFTAESIETKATVVLDSGDVTDIHLETVVKAPGIEDEKFQELAHDAKENCPISKLMKAEIHLIAKLV